MPEENNGLTEQTAVLLENMFSLLSSREPVTREQFDAFCSRLEELEETKDLHSEEQKQLLTDIKLLLEVLKEKSEVDENAESESLVGEYHDDISTINKNLELVNENLGLVTTHLENMENIQISMIVGIGLLIGAVCALILSNFVRH